MNILHVITDLNTGGAEMTLSRLLEALGPPEYDHGVVALMGPGALSGQVAKRSRLEHLGMRASVPSLKGLIRLRAILRATAPNVVHGWMYHSNLMVSLASLGLGRGVVWGIRHSLHDFRAEKGPTRLVIRAGARLSMLPDRIVYNSKVSASQHQAFGYRHEKADVIPNGFDTDSFRPDPYSRARIRSELGIADDAFVVGHIARWHPMKDHDALLRAAAIFARTHSRAVFVLVGEGVDAKNRTLVELMHGLGVTTSVKLCGRRDDMAAINAALDIASSSSRGEAFPNAVGEAMACGVPCVATDVGDVREIIGDTGIVVSPRDPAGLAAGWTRLAGIGADQLRVMGLRARVRIQTRYSMHASSQRYASLYQSLAGKG